MLLSAQTRSFPKYFPILSVSTCVTIIFYSVFIDKDFENSGPLKMSWTAFPSSLERYRQIHESIMLGHKTPIKVTINGYTNHGYGNKIYSLLSSLVLAILTDSAIVIRWQNINEFIEEPFYNSFRNFDSEMSEFNGNITYDLHVPQPSIYHYRIKKNMKEYMMTQVPSSNVTRVLYNNIKPYFFQLCSNPLYFEKLLGYNLTQNKTVQKALSLIGLENVNANTGKKK